MVLDERPPRSWLPAGLERDKAFNEKYAIEHELGIGGSGVVVSALHRELDTRVAIKFLLPSADPCKTSATRFRLEARAAKRLKNEHVVRIDDIATTESGVPYMVMEYLEGVDLERMQRQTPHRQLPIADAIDFVLQACEAVAESHALGIVHRDLKPSNLFCVNGADGLPMIKVLDFGISKVVDTGDAHTTLDGQILGSLPYMSPEQYSSATDIDRRTDIWSIGVTLYQLLTGQHPFPDGDLFRLRDCVRFSTPAPMNELRRDLPAALGSIVSKCLEKDRERRYANLAEFAKALLPCAPPRSRSSIARIVRIVEVPGCATASLLLTREELALSDTPTGSPVSLPVRRDRRWRRALTLLLSIALVATIGIVWLAGWQLARSVDSHPADPTSTRLQAEELAQETSRESTTDTTSSSPRLISRAVSPIAQIEQAPPNEAPARSTLHAKAVDGAGAAHAAPSRATVNAVVGGPANADKSTALPSKPSETPAPANGNPYVDGREGAPSPSAPSSAATAAPWITDIIEQRKGPPNEKRPSSVTP
jgi:serine/threonine protein kinase